MIIVSKSYEFQLRKENNHLHFSVKGERNPENLINLVNDITTAIKNNFCSRILVDLSAFGEPLTMLSSWKIVLSTMKNYTKQILISAAIIESEESLKMARFYERAARNPGYNLQVFTDEQKALD